MIDFMFTLAASDPIGHVVDKPIYGQWFVSNVTLMLIFSAVVTCWVILPAARRIATRGHEGHRTLDDYRAQGLHANFVEVICLYLRSEVFQPLLQKDTDKYVPMLWTFFWFILVSNLLGLVPFADVTALLGLNDAVTHPVPKEKIFMGWALDPFAREAAGHGSEPHGAYGFGGTATQSIWVTATLAAVAFVWFNGIGFLKDPKSYLKHMTGGAPWPMWPIMVPVEVIGTFVKPFALALRLFANMSGGHIIVATLLGFVVSLGLEMGGVSGHGLALIPLAGAVAIFLLEVFVAFLQAFIFTFLSSLFLSQLIVHEGHEHHEEGHEHEGEHAHAAASH